MHHYLAGRGSRSLTKLTRQITHAMVSGHAPSPHRIQKERSTNCLSILTMSGHRVESILAAGSTPGGALPSTPSSLTPRGYLPFYLSHCARMCVGLSPNYAHTCSTPCRAFEGRWITARFFTSRHLITYYPQVSGAVIISTTFMLSQRQTTTRIWADSSI